jgi:hypothetical protein
MKTKTRFTETETEYVLLLGLPDDADTTHLVEVVEDNTIKIRAPRRARRPVWIDHRFDNPEATPC